VRVEQRKFHGDNYAVFYIPIKEKMVYMKQQLFCSEEDLYFIIWVDRFRFESVWFKSSSTYAPELMKKLGEMIINFITQSMALRWVLITLFL
jgi:hypothetical protein